eukprot:2729651-Ditylum_brightwellii.AAC.1
MAAYGIFGEATAGCGYVQIRKKLNYTSEVKLPSKYIIDQIQSIEVEKMMINPDTSANNDSALSQQHVDLDSTFDVETISPMMSCAMPGTW